MNKKIANVVWFLVICSVPFWTVAASVNGYVAMVGAVSNLVAIFLVYSKGLLDGRKEGEAG